MSAMQSEVYEAFRAIEVPEDKALKAATAFSRRDDDVSSIRSELFLVKGMLGSVIAIQIAMLGTLFLLWAKIADVGGQLTQIAGRLHQ